MSNEEEQYEHEEYYDGPVSESDQEEEK